MLRVDDQAFRTDTGRQRSANEDSFFVRSPIFVVADGMGGAQAGEVASKAAAEAFDRDLPDGSAGGLPARDDRGRQPRDPRARPRATPRWPGWGRRSPPRSSTPADEEVAIGHVGDSRAYRLRDGKLERLTRDHSLVEELRRKGQLTDAQAEDHPQRSIITRALGPEPEVDVDLQTVPASPGDVFLICSDGLTTMVSEERIAQALAGATSMDAAVRALVDEANRAGRARQHHRARLPSRGRGGAARGPSEGATLVGPSAEEAGLTATEVRRRAAAAAAQERRERLEARRPPPPQADEDGGQGPDRRPDRRGARLRRLVREPSGLVPRHRRRRPGRPLPRPPLRTALRHRPLRRALREPDPDRLADQPPPRRGHRPRPALARGRRLPGRRNRKEPGDRQVTSAQQPGAAALWFPVALLLTAGFAAVFAQENAPARQPQPRLRRLLPRRLPRHPHLPAHPPARRRPLPLPAGRAADRLRPGDDLPDRREPGPRPGQLVRASASCSSP